MILARWGYKLLKRAVP